MHALILLGLTRSFFTLPTNTLASLKVVVKGLICYSEKAFAVFDLALREKT